MAAFMECNEEAYYWLGVLFADGAGNYPDYRLCLKSKHANFIQAFADYVSKPVKTGMGMGARSVVYRVDFYSKEIRLRLIELGYTVSRKADRALPEIPPSMVRHFLRGYFDGDGSIHKDRRKPNCWRLEWCVHKSASEAIKHLLEVHCPSANVRLYDKKSVDCLMIYNSEGVQEVLRFLYENASVCPHPKVKAPGVQSLVEGILQAKRVNSVNA